METAERLADIAARLDAREALADYIELAVSELYALGLREHFRDTMRWAYGGESGPDDDLRVVLTALEVTREVTSQALREAQTEAEELRRTVARSSAMRTAQSVRCGGCRDD